MGCKTNQINNVLRFCWQLQTKPCSDCMKEDDLTSDEEAKLGICEERTLTLPPGGCKGSSRSPKGERTFQIGGGGSTSIGLEEETS